MKRNHLTYFSKILGFGLILLPTYGIMAQNSIKQEGKIESQNFTIEKERKITIQPEITRSFNPIQELKDSSFNQSIPNDLKDLKKEIQTFSDLTIPVLEPGLEDKFQKNFIGEIKNFAKIGIGNYGHTLLSSHLAYAIKPNKLVGANFNFDHNSKGPENTIHSRRSDNQLKIYSKTFTPKYLMEGDLTYQNLGTNYYGRKSIPDNTDKNAYKIGYNRYNFNGKISNAIMDSKLDYAAGFNMTYFNSSRQNEEVLAKANFLTNYSINSDLNLKLEGDLILSQFIINSAEQNRNLFRLNPKLEYLKNGFNVHLGLNIAQEREKNVNLKNTNWYPNIELKYQIMPFTQVFGGLTGNTHFNSYTENSLNLPWLGQNIDLRNTKERVNFFTGIKGENEQLDYELKLAYQKFQDLSFFIPSSLDSSRFQIAYDGREAKLLTVFNLKGKINYQFNKQYRTSLSLDYNKYDNFTDLSKPFSRPNLSLSILNKIQFKERITISPDLYYISGLYGYRPFDQSVVKMKNIVDLNIKINYSVNEKISTYLSMNNLLGTQYQRYINYAVQGFNFTLGGMINF